MEPSPAAEIAALKERVAALETIIARLTERLDKADKWAERLDRRTDGLMRIR